jgi:hypothetical protein
MVAQPTPQVASDRCDRVGVLADPPAGLSAGSLGQHRPGTDRGHLLGPGPHPAGGLTTAPDPLAPGQHHRMAADREVAHPNCAPAVELGLYPTAQAPDHGGRGLDGEPPFAAHHLGRDDLKAVQAEQRCGELDRQRAQQPTDPTAHQGHGVAGGNRVEQRGGIQHPAHPDQPDPAGQLGRHPEDPIRIGRGAQPRPQLHQHRMRKPRHLVIHAGGVPPAQVIGKPIHGFPIRATLQPLQHHHHRQDRRRDRPAAVLDVQVSEQLVGEQPLALTVQQPVDRPLRQLRLTAGHRHVPQPALAFGQPRRHRPPSHQERHSCNSRTSGRGATTRLPC